MDKKEFDNEINFAKVLFLHINRILMSQTDGEFIKNVNLLESVLNPYIDDIYKDELDGKKDGIVSTTMLDPSIHGKRQMMNEEKTNLANIEFRALMNLAERKGLLLEKTSDEETWELEEEEEENANPTTDVAEATDVD